MATCVTSILGGMKLKNMRLVIFLEPKVYLETCQMAKEAGINTKTDSQMINGLLNRFGDIPVLQMKVESMQKGIANRESIIQTLRDEIQELKTKKKGKK